MKVIFFHLPKTAGSALVKSLHRSYFNWRRPLVRYHFGVCPRATLRPTSEETFAARKVVARYALNLRNVELVTGHIPYFDYKNTVKDSDQWVSVAVLRNPVDRWLSEYFYNYAKESLHMKVDQKLDEYLLSKQAKSSGELYCRWFSCDSDDVDTAIDNLKQIDCLGFQENLDEFVDLLGKRLQKNLTVKKINIRPQSQRSGASQVTDEQMEQIRELCAKDIKIYEHFV